jgi:hypothetical protein
MVGDVMAIIISFVLFISILLTFVYVAERLKEENLEETHSLYQYIKWTLVLPSYGIGRIHGKSDSNQQGVEATKLFIISVLMAMTITIFSIVMSRTGWDVPRFLLLTFETIILFQFISRVYALFRVIKGYKLRAEWDKLLVAQTEMEQSLQSKEEQKQEFVTVKERLEKELAVIQQRNEQITVFIEGKRVEMETHLAKQKKKLDIMARNLKALRKWEGQDVVLGVDTNILMQADDYIIEELKKHRLLISKLVQLVEVENNFKKAEGDKKKKAEKARKRLFKLKNEGVGIKLLSPEKWDMQFIKENNLYHREMDEKIIADYLFEHKQTGNVVILSCDKMFTFSASMHMPVIELEDFSMFDQENKKGAA